LTPIKYQNQNHLIGQAMLNNCKDKGKKLGRIPVLTYLSSSIWASPEQTLGNTVNVVGADCHASCICGIG